MAAYAPGITLRPWTVGGTTTTEAGEALFTRAKITASRSLMLWGATGWRYESATRTITSTEGAQVSGDLPVCDQSGWRTEGGAIIDVSVPNSYTHVYTIKVSQFRKDASGREIPVGEERTYANVFIPTGDLSAFDLDLMLPVSTVAGGVVLVPGTWDVKVAAAEAAAAASEAAAVSVASTAAATTRLATRRATLLDRGASDRALSSGARAVEWEDSLGGVFTEEWANLSAWSSGTFAQVSGGRLYSAGMAGASGANRGFAIAAGETARAVAHVRSVSGEASGGTIVGFTDDAVGGAFGGGGGNLRGLYFTNVGLKPFTDGTAGAVLAPLPSGTVDWLVTAVVDESFVTITARTLVSNVEVRYRWDRTGWSVNNLTVFNSDSRLLSGNSVGKLGIRKTLSTLPTVKGIEGTAPWCVWTSVGGAGMRIALPAGYDSRKPSPVAIMFHGNGSDETHWWANTNGGAVAEALLAGGYIVAGAAWTAAVSTWGNDSAVTANTALYDYLRDHFNIGPVVLYGNSMGGIDSLNLLARDTIPGVRAWAGTVPTYDLAENYANPLFTGTISSAYGGAYPVNSVGHDPALMEPSSFRGVPMWMLVATDDASVTPAANGLALASDLAATNDVTKIEVTGGHSTAQIAASAAIIVDFFDATLGR